MKCSIGVEDDEWIRVKTERGMSLEERTVSGAKASLAVLGFLAAVTASHLQQGQFSAFRSDLSGPLFILCACLYRGSPTVWWGLFVPAGGLLLFAPTGYYEIFNGMDLSSFLRGSIGPVLSLAAGAIVAATTETQTRAREAQAAVADLLATNSKLLKDLQEMRKALSEAAGSERMSAVDDANERAVVGCSALKNGAEPALQSASRPMLEMEPVLPVAEEAIAFGADPDFGGSMSDQGLALGGGDSPGKFVESISAVELIETVRQVVEERFHSTHDDRFSSVRGIRVMLTLPKDLGLPMAIRGRIDVVRTVTSALLENAIDALGGAPGVIRISMRAGLGEFTFSVEDNGRGFGEELLRRHQPSKPGRPSISEIRSLVEGVRGSFDIKARLGVGSRTTVEWTRVDAFAISARGSRRVDHIIPRQSSDLPLA